MVDVWKDSLVLFPDPVPRYVVDPGSDYPLDRDGIGRTDEDGTGRADGWWVPPSRRSVAALRTEGSLAVLGEPGIGKSTAIRQLVVVPSSVVDAGDRGMAAKCGVGAVVVVGVQPVWQGGGAVGS